MSTIRVASDQNGHSLAARIGDDIELRLPENRTTGYQWHLEDAGAPVCAIEKNEFEAPGSRPPGAAGARLCRLQVVQRGRALIRLVYRRSFGSAKSETFTLTVDAT